MDSSAGLGTGTWSKSNTSAVQRALSRRVEQGYLAVEFAQPQSHGLFHLVHLGEQSLRHISQVDKFAKTCSDEGLGRNYCRAAGGNCGWISETSEGLHCTKRSTLWKTYVKLLCAWLLAFKKIKVWTISLFTCVYPAIFRTPELLPHPVETLSHHWGLVSTEKEFIVIILAIHTTLKLQNHQY